MDVVRGAVEACCKGLLFRSTGVVGGALEACCKELLFGSSDVVRGGVRAAVARRRRRL